VVWALTHHFETATNKVFWDIFVEEVAHRVHEDGSRELPRERILNRLVVQIDPAVPATTLVYYFTVEATPPSTTTSTL
jgi:hypothetical protein